jgi:hypothetical protein
MRTLFVCLFCFLGLLVSQTAGQTVYESLNSIQVIVDNFPDLVALLQNLTVNTTVIEPSDAAIFGIILSYPPNDPRWRDILLYHMASPAYYRLAQIASMNTIQTLYKPASLGGRSQRLIITTQGGS